MWVRALHLLSLAAAIIHAQYYDEERTFRTCSTKCHCDNFNRSSGHRIVGGEEAAEHEFPFLAVIVDNGHICAASIITVKHFLTAAHCATLLDLTDTTLQIGLHNLTFPYRTLNVARLIKHPQYVPLADRENCGNDIAIGTTWETMQFGPKVQPACLPTTGGVTYKIGDKVYIAGWGRDTVEERTRIDLLKAEINIVSSVICGRIYKPQGITIKDTMICAGTDAGGKDTCQGDSGGPLMRINSQTKKRVVIGVVSFGIGCGNPQFPGVYTKVANFLPWIQKLIGSACLCSQT